MWACFNTLATVLDKIAQIVSGQALNFPPKFQLSPVMAAPFRPGPGGDPEDLTKSPPSATRPSLMSAFNIRSKSAPRGSMAEEPPSPQKPAQTFERCGICFYPPFLHKACRVSPTTGAGASCRSTLPKGRAARWAAPWRQAAWRHRILSRVS